MKSKAVFFCGSHCQAWATGHEEYNHEAWTVPGRVGEQTCDAQVS